MYIMIITIVSQQLGRVSHGMILYKVQHTNEMTQQQQQHDEGSTRPKRKTAFHSQHTLTP